MMIKKIECPTIAQDRFQFILPRGYFQRALLLRKYFSRENEWTLIQGSSLRCFGGFDISQWGTCVYCITAKLEALELSSGILLRANDKCGPRYYEPQNEYLGKILQNAVGMTYLPLWFLWNKIKMWLIWCWIMTGVQISY